MEQNRYFQHQSLHRELFRNQPLLFEGKRVVESLLAHRPFRDRYHAHPGIAALLVDIDQSCTYVCRSGNRYFSFSAIASSSPQSWERAKMGYRIRLQMIHFMEDGYPQLGS